ncbi:MAG: sulfatase-like hydrolase/transferase, partial [Oleibacter sp.]|nr:sulfatase-like hydrolase/transferase [Thalassolituus sp.]
MYFEKKNHNLVLTNPILWSLLVLTYPLINEIVFSDFVREGEYNSRIGWSFLTALLITIGNRRWFTALVLLPFFLGGICDIGYAYSFGGVFTTATMEAVAFTDQYEVIEYIRTYSTWQLNTLLFIFLTLYCCAIYFCKPPTGIKTRRAIYVLGCIMIIVVVYRTTVMGKFHDTIPGILGTLPSHYLGSISLDKEVELRREMLRSTDTTATNINQQVAQTHIFIIGESATKNHMGIYGYARNTTPNLTSLKNELVVLDNVISSHVQTQASLRVALTAAIGTDGDDYREAPSIIDIANMAGYKTYWISNQQPQRATIASISHQADMAHYISNDFNGVEVRRFDEYMLPAIKDAIEDPAPHKAIFIHMMGSHANYENRYPETFDLFQDNQVTGYQVELEEREV